MKNSFFSFLIIATLGLGMYGNCYADQYIDNLHNQMISHLESEGYQFTNIGDGWHTIKPMQTTCFEIEKPSNAPDIYIDALKKGDFRQEVAFVMNNYINYKPISVTGLSYEEIGIYGITPSMTLYIHDKDTETKKCIQNLSRKSNLYINYPLTIIQPK